MATGPWSPHGGGEAVSPVAVDQGHGSLDQVLGTEERVIEVGDHVDERVADADDIQIVHGGRP